VGRDPIGYGGGIHLYAYVNDNPLTYLDPNGKNIYLKSGNNTGRPINDAVHQSVCVDEWDSCGRSVVRVTCFSYGWYGRFRWFYPRWIWLGWSISWWEGTGGLPLMEGEIYEHSDVGTVINTKRTTASQDRAWRDWMRRCRKGLRDVYTAGWFNCRKYSQWEFADAPRSAATGCCQPASLLGTLQ